ncbi:kelch repeat protein [Colletotrichum karsti]|uniref:Kelch repeat protein n=1 Tax=Colletotrichum karsti TaxID=1095194 RepID=A0A9P6HW99_9PEZI|nr:kelch repeat protein [Colletotrichum karsti]KAF9872633.1 kelch repeat protein [Colletotrichum karsti]
MVSRLAALLAVGQLATTCYAQVKNVPDVDSFLRRGFPRTTVVGNYLYIDGGEVAQLVNGKNTSRPSDPVNVTLSIDLTTSWKPSDVTFKEIKKSAPTMMRQAIFDFQDNSTSAIYIWGGFRSYDGNVPSAALWKFNPDGSGGGSWNTEIKPGHSTFVNFERSQGGAFVSTPGAGFYFGGYSQATSDPTPAGPVPGYLKFNFTDNAQAWTNHTTAPYSQYGTLGGAAAHYVPNFGDNGLVMVLGGGNYPLGSSSDNTPLLAFDDIHFMDPVTDVWYSQKTSGTAPAPRQWHCAVGAQGQNNTYEIFVFGGTSGTTSFDEVWILSLPGFVWKKADYTSTSPRDAMGCAVGGQRQMITIGGIDRSWVDSAKFFKDKDPFPQGVGVFDMTQLKWNDQYDSSAAAYDTPDIVKSWYEEGNTVNYSNDEVAALFKKSNSDSGSGSGSGSGNSSSSDSESSSSNVGAIAGGVVGGVVGAAAIGLAAFCLLRRRKRQQPPAQDPALAQAQPYAPQHAYSPVPPSATITASELESGHTPPPDVPKMAHTSELPSDSRVMYELDGSGAHK